MLRLIRNDPNRNSYKELAFCYSSGTTWKSFPTQSYSGIKQVGQKPKKKKRARPLFSCVLLPFMVCCELIDLCYSAVICLYPGMEQTRILLKVCNVQLYWHVVLIRPRGKQLLLTAKSLTSYLYISFAQLKTCSVSVLPFYMFSERPIIFHPAPSFLCLYTDGQP